MKCELYINNAIIEKMKERKRIQLIVIHNLFWIIPGSNGIYSFMDFVKYQFAKLFGRGVKPIKM